MERKQEPPDDFQSELSVWKIMWACTVVGGFMIGLGFLLGFFSPDTRPDPTVKLLVEKTENGATIRGHGSAVAIGNGFFLTAAHVIDGEAKFTFLASDGLEASDIEVLWSSKKYDLALLKSPKLASIVRPADIDCRIPLKGAAVTLEGNPRFLTFIRVAGFIGSAPQVFGPWPVALIVDATVLGGMSGGPVFDSRGRVVAIAVGVMVTPSPFGSPPTGLAAVVPASVACMLMGRA